MRPKPPQGYHGHFNVPGGKKALPASGAARAPMLLPTVSRGVVQWQLPSVTSAPVKVKRVNDRVYQGETIPSKVKLGRKKQGDLGQNIAHAWLESIGRKVTPLRLTPEQKAADLFTGKEMVEVKTGSAANGRTARQWMSVPGSKSKAEKKYIKSLDSAAKKQFYLDRYAETKANKEKLLAALSEHTGKKVRPMTIALIADLERQRVDVHVFDHFFKQQHWNDELTKKSYIGTYRYA
jgi:hypothetical protein